MQTLRTAPAVRQWLGQAQPRAAARHLSTTSRLAQVSQAADRRFWLSNSSLSRQQLFHGAPFLSYRPQQRRAGAFNALPTRSFSSSRSNAQVSSPEVQAAANSLTHPQVATYLLTVAGLVFAIVIVGGMTRLTESGLSITEWNVITGVLPPMNDAQWEQEFAKYRATPEWRQQNQRMTIDEFKSIFYWEWSHRILGRVIGLAFLLPLPYFYARKRISGRTSTALLAIGTLIGGQGALGWYMVKSGLTDDEVRKRDGIARVSQYRLAAHLGMAFTVYVMCLRTAFGIRRDWALAHGKPLKGLHTLTESLARLESPQAARLRFVLTALASLVFVTALSGAFVAGLDAGLIYNEFPTMGEGRIAPPRSELLQDKYSRREDKRDLWWRNMLENPVTVQLDHRALAMTTFACIIGAFMYARRPAMAASVPPAAIRLAKGTMHMSVLQVALGISTLIYLVPPHLAATHQTGSLVLLSLAVLAASALRRPSDAARAVMRARAIQASGSRAGVSPSSLK